jgi:methyl-coenzyme M reductase subunit D
MRSASSPEAVPLPEIMIMPSRLLSADTTEKVLNRIYEVEHVRQVTCQGENLPKKLNLGPGTGLDVNHPERKKITVKGKETELWVQVGRIFVEVDDIDNVQKVTEAIEKICEELFPFGFDLEIGRYSKFKPTTTDYAKGRC